MIRFLACTATACLAASCVPPKAILVEAAPVQAPKPEKPAVEQKEQAPPEPPVFVQQGNRMRTPTREATRLPENKDFIPTAQTAGNAGAVIASPPGEKSPGAPKVNE